MGCSNSKTTATTTTTATLTVPTRQRVDSWAVNTTKTMDQWHWLWKTLAKDLIDPADCSTVIQERLSYFANQLGTVQIYYLVSYMRQQQVQQLPHQTIALHLQLHERVAAVAIQSAQDAQINLDVNHWDMKKTTTPPKPSIVRDLTEPPTLPTQLSILSYAAVLGMALHGTYHQRSALLFTMCLDLEQVLATHPAGGMPIWLLEIDANLVFSVASLTHYHYYGTAYLPKNEYPHFIPSTSRQPLTIKCEKLMELIGGGGGVTDTASLLLLQQQHLTLDEFRTWMEAHMTMQDLHLVLSKQFQDILPDSSTTTTMEQQQHSTVFGGIGNIDGRGALGTGVCYCVDKKWYDSWKKYLTDGAVNRPHSIANHRLVEGEQMKQNLKLNTDYVLVSPGTWDSLFQLFGGGPPLPRMVIEGEIPTTATSIPPSIRIQTHPWIVHCHLCDPQQPYRRGDVGSLTLKVMTTPEQPAWRLVAELLCRFPIGVFRGFDEKKMGKVRLWIRSDTNGKDPQPRYGPWTLLFKNRFATISDIDLYTESKERDELVESWKSFTDNQTVGDVKIKHGNHIMLEFAVPNKAGELMWPREAAAKAGMVKRIAEEDRKFRQILQGIDDNGNPLLPAPPLVGMEVDAMDSTGRWYPVKILDVEIVDDDTEEETDDVTDENEPLSKKRVKVSFEEHKGHIEWIDIESDRLAKRGRFTGEAENQVKVESPKSPGKKLANGSLNGSNHGKQNNVVAVKRSGSGENQPDSSKLCQFPGFGACGLANLGNTCYANSAIQCMGYTPFLRSFLLSNQYKLNGDINKDNPLGTGGKLLEEFAELLRAMWSGKLGEKSPIRFRTQLGKMNPQFSGTDQHDAQEFLNYIMDALHEDSNRIRKKPYVESVEDEWVLKNSLPRVGDESWRRFLRRNNSIMSDIGMGQVLNTVKCPVCKFSSRNFDPFSILSIPVPTNVDVLFECTLYRRMDAFSSNEVLNRPKRGSSRTARFSRQLNSSKIPNHHPNETYIISMSRLADSSELPKEIEKVTGIPAARLRICRTDTTYLDADSKTKDPRNSHCMVIPLTDKEGPCSQLVRKRKPEEDESKPFRLVAFESSLKTRSIKNIDQNGNGSIDDETRSTQSDSLSKSEEGERKLVDKILASCADERECRIFDTNISVLSKYASQMMWPADESEFQVGLRVDAKDQRGNWFSGSVVEVADNEVNTADVDTGKTGTETQRKIKVHFDNFSTKWDEEYDMSHFKKQKVTPLYSFTPLGKKPVEFLIHHRFTHPDTGKNIFFGTSFIMQAHHEWSNARAGAQILSQATRFLQRSEKASSANKSHLFYEKTFGVISELIDILLRYDSDALSYLLIKKQENGSRSLASIDAELQKKIEQLLLRCPFDIVRASVESLVDIPTGDDEEAFPFLLSRNIGNYMTSRNVLILQWRQPHSTTIDLTAIPRSQNMYIEPQTTIDEESTALLETKTKEAKEIPASADGVNISVCLKEFCKTQSLSLDDNWRCPRCKDFREGRQSMNLWRLPDILTFHIKRFNMSARWREKITTKVDFPLYGLDMSDWCHEESPALHADTSEPQIYDLFGVMNHYGSMTGGHYVASCKATACSKDGREEVAFPFNGTGTTHVPDPADSQHSTGWRLTGRKETNKSSHEMSKYIAESAEPLWLQFDDELVEPIPPDLVVSETAYVLFYRRRQLTPSNIAKYSVL